MTAEWVVEALNQLYDGAFPAATASHQRHSVASLHADVDASQHRDVGSGRVVEVNLLQVDVAVNNILEHETNRESKLQNKTIKVCFSKLTTFTKHAATATQKEVHELAGNKN